MIVLHPDWADEPDAQEIFEVLLKRLPNEIRQEKQDSPKTYQIFADHEGGVGLFCDDSLEDYAESIKDCSPRYDVKFPDYAD